MLFLVTGSTGNVGGELASVLLELGHQVRAVTRSATHPAGVRSGVTAVFILGRWKYVSSARSAYVRCGWAERRTWARTSNSISSSATGKRPGITQNSRDADPTEANSG